MGWSRQFRLTVMLAIALVFMPFIQLQVLANEKMLIPMGQSIGIHMNLAGIFITNDVMIGDDQWLLSGDLIEKVNETPIKALTDFQQFLIKKNELKNSELLIVRNGEPNMFSVNGDALKRLVPFLKDRTEGTGTLTYVDPLKKTYGALGHQIIDSALKSPPTFKTGAIYLSEINQIKKSVPGIPGYKISSIVEDEDFLGTIDTNGIYGIFGSWNSTYKEVLAKPLEIMQPGQIQKGEAEIFTTVKGTDVETFSITIIAVEKDQFQFVMTDPKLLKQTGGILQGMSGSPVIQNGKFAGAVTHMFVDDPTKGAALYLETMQKGEK